MKRYLNILIDAINKKDKIMDDIRLVVDEIEICVLSPEFSLEKYNDLMMKKGKLIEDMNRLDDGFTAVYARISPELRESTTDYTDQIKVLQEMITKVSDKTALIQAKELRIQSQLDRVYKGDIHKGTVTASKADVAQKYAKTMNRTTVAPASIFINKKN